MLEVANIRRVYTGGERESVAIEDISFRVANGEFVSLLGPSGCGKTTLLRCISGLIEPTSGRIGFHTNGHYQGAPRVGMVFQDYGRSLFPWMTVADNLLFPIRRKKPKTELKGICTEALEAVNLTGNEDRYPWQLSGGMQQRVAIARALAFEPELLLMDEPFAAVDAQTRGELEDMLLRVWERFRITTLFVTHDIDEAVYLSDRVIVLSASPGRVVEDIRIALPRPRDQIETKNQREFAERRTRAYQLLRSRPEPANSLPAADGATGAPTPAQSGAGPVGELPREGDGNKRAKEPGSIEQGQPEF